MVDQLKQFRLQIEKQMGEPISEIDPPALLLFNDLCEFLNLTEEEKCQVLGEAALKAVYEIAG